MARSGYHAWAVREDCDRVREDRVLSVHVAAAFERGKRTCGSPRIRIDLQEDSMRVGRSRIARLRRESGLIALRKKAFRATPDSCPTDRVLPNRLGRKFVARAPNRKWVTDVKHVRTSAGWLYPAPVIDLFSRRAVGCAISTEQDGKLSVAALTSALEARGNPRNVIVHSYRGGIYGDDEYVKKANARRLRREKAARATPVTTR